ncbi:MAG: tetratricopeptide repeat protein [Patescibacteria group bacterium]|nr:tetratricopeptide repeat protein [Patescibacteria group bacterium]
MSEENLSELEERSIDAAINNRWDEAIALNEKIIEKDKKNLDAYLRLGFAYLQKGNLQRSKKAYLMAKKIQPENYLVEENLKKIKILEEKNNRPYSSSTLDPNAFLDIPGRTKSVALVNCGQKDILASLSIGQELQMNLKKRKIEIRTKNKDYVGCLPDDLSKRLSIFIKNGSIFKCYVKEANLKKVVVFLKEEKRGKKIARYIPFAVTSPSASLNQNQEDQEHETEDEGEEYLSDSDLEKLAESLATEEKEDYLDLGYQEETQEEES